MAKEHGFFDELVGDDLAEKTVKYSGREKTIYVRKLSGADRLKLSAGQKFRFGHNVEQTQTHVELRDIELRKQMMVQFCICKDEHGNRAYSKIEEVQKLPDSLINDLAALAEEVNREDLPAGKG